MCLGWRLCSLPVVGILLGLLLSLAKHSFTVVLMIGSAADIHSVTKTFNTVSSPTAAGLVAVADGFVLRLFGREAIVLKTITFL